MRHALRDIRCFSGDILPNIVSVLYSKGIAANFKKRKKKSIKKMTKGRQRDVLGASTGGNSDKDGAFPPSKLRNSQNYYYIKQHFTTII